MTHRKRAYLRNPRRSESDTISARYYALRRIAAEPTGVTLNGAGEFVPPPTGPGSGVWRFVIPRNESRSLVNMNLVVRCPRGEWRLSPKAERLLALEALSHT